MYGSYHVYAYFTKKSVTLYRSHSDRRLDHFRYFCEEKFLKHNFSVQLFRGRLKVFAMRVFSVYLQHGFNQRIMFDVYLFWMQIYY